MSQLVKIGRIKGVSVNLTKKVELKKMSDEELMQAYMAGESVAFEILYERHSAKVLGYLIKKTRSPKNAQDLMQESFLKLHRSRHLFNSVYPFAPWLFTITRSVFLDSVKKKSLEDSTETKEFDKIAAIQDVKEDTTIDLNILPEMQRQIVSLRIYDEETFDAIAKRLSMTPENARQIFSRAVKLLKSLATEGVKK